ncbi:salicylate synthase MbtI [Gordonia neofelifaecis NRRL B-59395]|uniref:Salicylate synthase MbtI n=1 Tax=Gordonia neofelifaecis NRRL B-59395 TaxID=644548 RepID=F1YJM5_9ACTN|nr:salicylate synthase MbtI [Gordonia neofelifaecis NRRL B-59395]
MAPASPVADTPSIDDLAARAAAVCGAWASSGEFGEYVVYERDGRWMFAARPQARIILTKTQVIVDPAPGDEGARTREISWAGDPADALNAALDGLGLSHWRLYGWVGFDYCAPHHGLLDRVQDDVVLAHLIVPGLEAFVDVDGISAPGADEATLERLRELAERPVNAGSEETIDVGNDPDDYRGRVATAVREINEGRYQKVILSRSVDVGFDVDIPATYVRGRRGNNPARSYLLHLGGLEAAGFSPELVVAADGMGSVVTEPLAGTRAFGRSPEIDAAARADLLSDEKEIAEHAMSVRACFTEIESVALPGTTVVDEFMVVRERGSVQHLASTVSGRLDPDAGPWRALGVLFPSITASGIPKAPALEAIYRLEPQRRELYSGAILVADSSGELEATLALRTIFAEGDRAWLRAGAGIVGQSRPEREFEETCEKLGSVAPFVVRAAR